LTKKTNKAITHRTEGENTKGVENDCTENNQHSPHCNGALKLIKTLVLTITMEKHILFY
jgi:hypothetical protein